MELQWHKDSSFDSFANVFMTYIETTTLYKTVFRTTVWKCHIHDIFSLWDMSKPDIEAFIEEASLHHPTVVIEMGFANHFSGSPSFNKIDKIPEYVGQFRKEWLYIRGINKCCERFVNRLMMMR